MQDRGTYQRLDQGGMQCRGRSNRGDVDRRPPSVIAAANRNQRKLVFSRSGYTLAELVMVCFVLATLAGIAMPTAKYTQKRVKEGQLRQQLRQMRNAIDEYKRYSDAGLLPVEVGTEGYPEDFEQLLEPQEIVGQLDKQIRFLRRIPVDPMTGEMEWGKRSTSDRPDDSAWGGENLFDVYSTSGGVGLNGVPYSEW